MPSTPINLTTTAGVTEPFEVGVLNKLSAVISVGSTYTSSSWVVDLQWSPVTGTGYEQWVTYSPTQQLTSSVLGLPCVSVTARGWIRWKTSTAQALADPAAVITWVLR